MEGDGSGQDYEKDADGDEGDQAEGGKEDGGPEGGDGHNLDVERDGLVFLEVAYVGAQAFVRHEAAVQGGRGTEEEEGGQEKEGRGG